mmetsp:Transcript_1118/g.3148  ORF Transcript_1118/g.3148 Transcript_1118/m.3148 type:complete len:532 (+) Transcript_1118:47-1642(+)
MESTLYLEALPSELVTHALGFLHSDDLARASQVSNGFKAMCASAVERFCAAHNVAVADMGACAPSRALHYVESRLRAEAHRRLASAGNAHCVRVLPDGSIIVTDDHSNGAPTARQIARSSTRPGLSRRRSTDKGTPPRSRAPFSPLSPKISPVDGSADAAAIAAVAAGDGFTLVATASGDVFSFGDGADGALGLGAGDSVPEPVLVQALAAEHVVDVAAGFSHSVFVTQSGSVFTCGWGHAGRLGHGDGDSLDVPRRVAALDGVHAVLAAAGEDHTLVVDAQGRAWAFGSGADGQLGSGSEAPALLPARVLGSLEHSPVVLASAGERHSLFLSAQGDVYACGCGEHGRLGLGSDESVSEPTRVPLGAEGARAVAIAAGGKHSVAIDDAGRVWVWGEVPADWQEGLPQDRARTAWLEPAAEARTRNAPVVLLEPSVSALLPPGVRAVAAAAGLEYSLIIGDDGECYMLGSPTSRDDAMGEIAAAVDAAIGAAGAAAAAVPPPGEGGLGALDAVDDALEPMGVLGLPPAALHF